MQCYWGQRGEDKGEHGAREYGAKEAKRQKRHGKNKGTTEEASDMWENTGTDMATEVRIKRGNGTKGKYALKSDQTSWPGDESDDQGQGYVSEGESEISS